MAHMKKAQHQILHGIARFTNRLRGDISFVTRRDITWALSKKNFVDRCLINGYYYEPDRLDKCASFIKSYRIEAFLDIGANFGLYSLHLARHAKIQEIHAFEPVRQNFNQLCANIFLNRFDRVIRPYHLGLSNEEGKKAIYVDSLCTGVSKF